MSKFYKDYITVDVENKLNRVVFVGSLDCPYDKKSAVYQSRKELVKELSRMIDVDVFPANDGRTWEEYMTILSHYRFVLSPFGNGNSIVTRFYEALLVKSIPIQQVRGNLLDYYDIEAGFEDCIYFKDVKEIPEKIKNCTYPYSSSELWLEDYLVKLLKEDHLL